ncbi:MAG: pitrilysin family protein [Calditrichia bacterium]
MKRFVFYSLLLLLTGVLMAEKQDQGFFPYNYEIYKLENGFTTYLIPVEGSGLVAYYSIVRTGSRDEWEQGRSGFAHFFEHMMFRGTEKYPGSVYDSLVTTIGADANAYTTDDLTAYHMVFPSEYLEKVMDLESDRFQNLSYKEDEFKTEAGAVYGEYRKGRVNPYSVLLEELQNTAFDKHTYKHTTIGFEEDIKNMPNLYDYSLSFFKRYYRPENVVLVMAGDFKPEKAKSLIKKYYKDWQPGYVKPQITPEPPQKEERVKEVSYAGKTLPIVWVAYKGDAFDPNSKMIAASDLLSDLAFGQNSALYKKLVLDEQKVQYVESWFPYTRDPKLLSIYSMVKDEADIPYVREQMDETIAHFKDTPVDPKKLEDVKKRLRYSFLMNLDTPDHIAGNLARMVALTGGIESVDQIYKQIDSITPEDIQAAAKHFFNKNQRTVIVLKGEA